MIGFILFFMFFCVVCAYIAAFVYFAKKYGPRLGDKMGWNAAGYFISGLVGATLLFALICSEEIIRYAHFRFMCGFVVTQKIYNPVINELHDRQYALEKVKNLDEAELNFYKTKYPVIDKNAEMASIDPYNVIGYSYDTYKLGAKITVVKVIDLKTNELIYESEDFWGTAGIISDLITIWDSMPIQYGFCSMNNLGPYKKK
jgi:hypothetical protein